MIQAVTDLIEQGAPAFEAAVRVLTLPLIVCRSSGAVAGGIICLAYSLFHF
jgi:hypothetical protein